MIGFKRIRSQRRWRRLRLAILANQPLCVSCQAKGLTKGAEELDHIVPLHRDPDRAFDLSNLQPLCRECHQEKTLRERPRKAITGCDADGNPY